MYAIGTVRCQCDVIKMRGIHADEDRESGNIVQNMECDDEENTTLDPNECAERDEYSMLDDVWTRCCHGECRISQYVL